jgi:hypothetical protein
MLFSPLFALLALSQNGPHHALRRSWRFLASTRRGLAGLRRGLQRRADVCRFEPKGQFRAYAGSLKSKRGTTSCARRRRFGNVFTQRFENIFA